MPAPALAVRFSWRSTWKELSWDLKALAIGFVVVTLLGLVWLVLPHKEEPIVPVLGIVVPAPSPSPTPKPTPRPAPTPSPKPRGRWLPW